jgi:hypothetical protein
MDKILFLSSCENPDGARLSGHFNMYSSQTTSYIVLEPSQNHETLSLCACNK